MADLKSIFNQNKKILFFVLGFVVVIGVGSWLVFSSPDEEPILDEDGVAVGGGLPDEQKTSEAEQLAKDIAGKLDFFSQKDVLGYFENNEDLIPVTVEISELAVENPFSGFPRPEEDLFPEEEAGEEEVIPEQ